MSQAALDAETTLLLCDASLEDAQREALRLREAWRAGSGDVATVAAAEARLLAAREARRLALARWLALR